MFCTKCGSLNSEEAQLCSHCSAPLTRSARQSSSPPPAPPQSSYPGYSSSGNQPMPPSYQPYQGYQSNYAGYNPPMPASASGRAIAAMVLSIVSFVTCGPFLSIPGLILGKVELNAIREGRAPQAGETYAKVGFYLGIAVTVLYCLGGAIWTIIAFFGALGGMH